MSFKSIFMAISTYSIIPVPQFEWKQENWKFAICWFPIVGIFSGGAMAIWIYTAQVLNISRFLYASISVCIPLVVTGGIHMDGFMDTADALASHQNTDRKLEILKDPNVGAFAVIYAIIYVLISLGLFYQLGPKPASYIICPSYVISRVFSAYYAISIKNARTSGMLNAFTESVDRRKANIILTFLVIIPSVLIGVYGGLCGVVSILATVITGEWYKRFTIRKFGGCTGDTAGFFLQICELSMLTAITIGGSLI